MTCGNQIGTLVLGSPLGHSAFVRQGCALSKNSSTSCLSFLIKPLVVHTAAVVYNNVHPRTIHAIRIVPASLFAAYDSYDYLVVCRHRHRRRAVLRCNPGFPRSKNEMSPRTTAGASTSWFMVLRCAPGVTLYRAGSPAALHRRGWWGGGVEGRRAPAQGVGPRLKDRRTGGMRGRSGSCATSSATGSPRGRGAGWALSFRQYRACWPLASCSTAGAERRLANIKDTALLCFMCRPSRNPMSTADVDVVAEYG